MAAIYVYIFRAPYVGHFSLGFCYSGQSCENAFYPHTYIYINLYTYDYIFKIEYIYIYIYIYIP